MTYIHVAEGCWIESEMHRGRLICAFFVRTWHKQVFLLHSLCYPGTTEPLNNMVRYNTVLVIIRTKIGPQMTS